MLRVIAGIKPPFEMVIPLTDLDGAKRVSDPSLPAGAAFWLPLHSRPQGVFLVSSSATEAEVSPSYPLSLQELVMVTQRTV